MNLEDCDDEMKKTVKCMNEFFNEMIQNCLVSVHDMS